MGPYLIDLFLIKSKGRGVNVKPELSVIIALVLVLPHVGGAFLAGVLHVVHDQLLGVVGDNHQLMTHLGVKSYRYSSTWVLLASLVKLVFYGMKTSTHS